MFHGKQLYLSQMKILLIGQKLIQTDELAKSMTRYYKEIKKMDRREDSKKQPGPDT